MCPWQVEFDEAFRDEFRELSLDVREQMAARLLLLELRGPLLGRPMVDTLKGSKHANMKELRFQAADAVWRAAFAFDPDRKAIVLVAGDKAGISKDRFYRSLIERADRRFDLHLLQRRQRGKRA